MLHPGGAPVACNAIELILFIYLRILCILPSLGATTVLYLTFINAKECS
jgi:hypothetical protein